MRAAGPGAALALLAGPALAQPTVWAFEAEQFEYRVGEGSDQLAWDTDFYIGTDELKVRWISEGAYALEENSFEAITVA